ncbi:MAG: HisA/HisF-related TIM barrel protein, partial [Methylocystaceae bacterium]
MIIYPAVDLREGKCVRLVQGRKEDMTVYSNDPVGMAIYWADQGACWLHVVDLDGAFEGHPRNLDTVQAIAQAVDIKIQFGGGMRNLEDVYRALDAGAKRVIIGTRAVEDPDFMLFLLNELGSDKIILGLDAIDGMVAVEGWEKKSSIGVVDFAQTAARMGAATAVYTDVARDGLLRGPNYEGIKRMVV